MDWKIFSKALSEKYNIQNDINHILFLIGINERGNGYAESYDKEEKMELIKLGKGKVLTLVGLYSENGVDNEGWPRFSQINELSTDENTEIKQGIIEYFKNDL